MNAFPFLMCVFANHDRDPQVHARGMRYAEVVSTVEKAGRKF